MNWSYLIDAIPKFVDAAKLTLELSVYGVVLSLLFGLPVAVVTAYRIRPSTHWHAPISSCRAIRPC